MSSYGPISTLLGRLGRLEGDRAEVPYAEIQDLLTSDPARGWRIFVEKYSKFVWAVALRSARGLPDPEEFAAEVYGRVFERLRADDFRRLREFQGKCDFRTYLFRVVKTERFRLHRHRGVETAARERLAGEAAARDEEAAREQPGGWSAGLGREAVRETLAELDGEDREILVLRFGSGLKLRELAEVLGLKDTNAAAYRLRRALGQCRALRRARASGTWDDEAFEEACAGFRESLFQNASAEVSDPDEKPGGDRS